MEQGYSINIDSLKCELKLINIKVNEEKYKPDLNKIKKEFEEKEILNGDMIEKLFFPTDVSYDIFISHSHNDGRYAEKLAVYLENKGYKVFLDSKIWGSADELLKLIDNKYCKQENKSYSYEKRNFSTSHVHSLLNCSLSKAIERSKYSIFITGENSISTGGNSLEGKVLSPWIYQELYIYNLIMRQKRKIIKEGREFSDACESLQIERAADISTLKEFGDFYSLDNHFSNQISFGLLYGG